MKNQIPGQMNIFDFLVKEQTPIWKRYPASIVGICPACGNTVFYDGTYRNPYAWIAKDPECERCGARFSKEGPPKDLPVLDGITDEPIVLKLDCTGYTETDIKNHGGLKWIRHMYTGHLSKEDKAQLDAYMLSHCEDIESMDEKTIVDGIEKATGLKFKYNAHCRIWQCKKGKWTYEVYKGHYATGVFGGKAFISSGYADARCGSSGPWDSLEEAANFIKRHMEKQC